MDALQLIGLIMAGFFAVINLIFFIIVALYEEKKSNDMTSTIFFALVFIMNTIAWLLILFDRSWQVMKCG